MAVSTMLFLARCTGGKCSLDRFTSEKDLLSRLSLAINHSFGLFQNINHSDKSMNDINSYCMKFVAAALRAPPSLT